LRRTLSVVLSAVLLVGLASKASAVDLPKFDVKLHCVTFADPRGGGPCERGEKAARYAILAKWGDYPLQRRHFCVQAETIRPKGERSYVTLAQCLGEPTATS
jgi:hypothetical protein